MVKLIFTKLSYWKRKALYILVRFYVLLKFIKTDSSRKLVKIGFNEQLRNGPCRLAEGAEQGF